MQRIPLRSLLRDTLRFTNEAIARATIRAAIWVAICAVLCASLVLPAAAQGRSRDRWQQNAPGSFDYYLLALSWAPNFCATHSGNFNECGTGRHVAFVVHGLWPQSERGRLDLPCQHTAPVAGDIVRYALNFYPDAGLVQHEWQCHGVYSGLSARDYFTAVGHAYQSLHLPPSIAALSQDTEENAAALALEFERSNSAPPGSFVSSCHDGELVAIEACFTKDLRLRSCSPGLRSCSGQLLLRAPH
jgi:ribonuclease T2